MFLPVKRAPCAAVLSRLMDAIQAILEDSVRTLFRTPDFPALADEVGPEFGPLLSSGKKESAYHAKKETYKQPQKETAGIVRPTRRKAQKF